MVKAEINVYMLSDSSINIYFKDKNKNKLVNDTMGLGLILRGSLKWD